MGGQQKGGNVDSALLAEVSRLDELEFQRVPNDSTGTKQPVSENCQKGSTTNENLGEQ